jgi:uncharacterized delta-60 repeat protein
MNDGFKLSRLTLRVRASAWQPFIRAVRSGAVAVIGFASFTSVAQTPGDFDTTPLPAFGNGTGKVIGAHIGVGNDRSYAMALQSDGKIVLAGECLSATRTKICMTRLMPDGSLDTSFVGPDNNGGGKFMFSIGPTNDYARALAIQNDGKIVVAAYCSTARVSDTTDMCVARLNPNGTLDDTFVLVSGFPEIGKYLIPRQTSDEFVNAIAIQTDGKIVLGGACRISTHFDMCAFRLNANGSIDYTFGPSSASGGFANIATGSGDDNVYSMALLPDGRLLLAGHCARGIFGQDFCFVRLNGDGSLDNVFDGPEGTGNGIVSIPIYPFQTVGSSDDYVMSVILQPDLKAIAVGHCSAALVGTNICAVRINFDGTLDTGFGVFNDGKATFKPGGSAALGYAVVQQPDGRIVIAGQCRTGAGDDDWCLIRLYTDGTLDPSFDGPPGALPRDGRFVFALGGSAELANKLIQQPDGKLLVSGYCNTGGGDRFCVARMLDGTPNGTQCTHDIDGDGIVSAERDSLILTRALLGFRGAAIVNGITFAGNAKRNDWSKVRDFLGASCGLSVY